MSSNSPIKINLDELNDVSSKPSVNFGPGVEMLMNEKKKSNSSGNLSSDINNTDLDNLENELDNLSSGLSKSELEKNILFETPKINNESIKLNIDGFDNDDDNDNNNERKDIGLKLRFEDNDAINLGKASANEERNDNSTWDGFKTFNDIPVDPIRNEPPKPQLSREELLKKKFDYLRKFEMLERKGVQLSKKYNMDSSLDEMQAEYEMIKDEKEKHNSVKFQGKMMMALVTGLEWLNNKFDPFDLKLDGWAESVTENIDDYDEIFGELHEKYKTKAKMAPELKLLFQLGGSAIMLHMTNTMFKSALPGMDDIMKQNPELMQQFTQAAVNSMSQQNPGFGGFMNGIMQGQNQNQGIQNNNQSKNIRMPNVMERPEIIPPNRHSTRPDIGMSRGIAEFDDSENMENTFSNPDKPERSRPSQRPEMKGPSNISDLLNNLKPIDRTINQQTSVREQNNRTNINNKKQETGSTISIDELKSISTDADNVPRRTKRKPRSERNTVSLDI